MRRPWAASIVTAALVAILAVGSGTATARAQPVVEGSPIGVSSNSESLASLIEDPVGSHYEVSGQREDGTVGTMRVTKLQADVYQIDEETTDHAADGSTNNPSSMYLVVGASSAALIDAGNGESYNAYYSASAMSSVLDEMVGDKDLSVIITHNHGDHIGLLRDHDVIPSDTPVYISTADLDGLDESVAESYSVHTLDDGDTVAAGDRTLTTVVLPGHTNGSTIYVDNADEVIFSGDTIGSGSVWLSGNDDLTEYDASVDRLDAIVSEMESPIFYAGHRWQQSNGAAHADETTSVNEMGKEYVFEMDDLLDRIAAGENEATDPYAPFAGHVGLYTPKSDLNEDGAYPGIVATNDAVELLREQRAMTRAIALENGGAAIRGTDAALLVDATSEGLTADERDALSGLDLINVSSLKDPGETSYDLGGRTVRVVPLPGTGAEERTGASSRVREVVDVPDCWGYVDEEGGIAVCNIDLGTPESPKYLADDDSAAGASYYNMVEFDAAAIQATDLLGDAEGAELLCTSTGAFVDDSFVFDMETMVSDHILAFDHSFVYEYDHSRPALNLIAQYGSATLEFHVQTNGWWGYGVGGDSIVDQVFETEDGYAQDQQTAFEHSDYFTVAYDVDENGNGLYFIKDTDLHNPMVIMDEDEALLIDTGWYGAENIHDAVQRLIGDREISIYITHQHLDHIIGLSAWDPDEVKTLYYPFDEPLAGNVGNGYTYEDLIGKFDKADKLMRVSDGDELSVAGHDFEVIAMEAHTVGETQLLDTTDRILFAGDSVGSQTFRGGTQIALSAVPLWQQRIEEDIERLGIGTDACAFDVILNGHTPYPMPPEYILWLQTCVDRAAELGMGATTQGPSGTVIVTLDGEVVSSEDILGYWENVPTDDFGTRFCSITLNDDSTPAEPDDGAPDSGGRPAGEDDSQDQTTSDRNETNGPGMAQTPSSEDELPTTGDATVSAAGVLAAGIATAGYAIVRRLRS